jgi:hypothetical protein
MSRGRYAIGRGFKISWVGVDIPWVGRSNYHRHGFDISWLGGVKIPWIGVKIPWV